MSRKPNIKWRKSDEENLNKAIKHFNDKIYRTRKAHPELKGILPDTIKKADKLKMIEEFKENPRNVFKNKINSLERFTRRGAEKEVVSKTGNRVTAWEKKEVEIKVNQYNREIKKERDRIEQMDATSQGEKLNLKRGQMGSERLNNLNPIKFDFDKKRGGREWELFKQFLDKKTSPKTRLENLEEYKMNYIKAMESTFGDYARETIEKLKQLPADFLTDVYYSEQEATIEFIYDPKEMEIRLEVINKIWEKATKENPNLLNTDNWSEVDDEELEEWIAEKG